MQIAIIGTQGLPATYGGFETIVQELAMRYRGQNTWIVYSDKTKITDTIFHFEQISIGYKATGASSIIFDFISVYRALFKDKCERVLILGANAFLFYAPLILFKPKGVIIITNPDGIEWKRKKWNIFTRCVLYVSEFVAVKMSDRLISDNEYISIYLKNKYRQSSELISCGHEHALPQTDVKCSPSEFGNYFLKIARIEPENNIELILNAFSETNQSLVLVGNWDYSKYSRKLKEQFNDCHNMHLIGPIYNKNEIARLRENCIGYVHGHSVGGTNPSLVEMLGFSKPIFAFDCVYNRMTLDNFGYFFASYTDLVSLLNKDINRFEKDLGSTKYYAQLARRKYKWSKIAENYFNIVEKEN